MRRFPLTPVIDGYFKKLISADEKLELLEVIENYRTCLIPLIVPTGTQVDCSNREGFESFHELRHS
ncbi:MAG: DUF1722 domain-containing protein [Candidatus Brocadia sp.]